MNKDEILKKMESILNDNAERIAELEKENARLKERLKHRNCVDCSNHSSKLKMRTLELEKENAELRNNGFTVSAMTEQQLKVALEKGEQLEKENAELKSRDCWKSCEYANPKSELIAQHIKDVQQLTEKDTGIAKLKEQLSIRFEFEDSWKREKEEKDKQIKELKERNRELDTMLTGQSLLSNGLEEQLTKAKELIEKLLNAFASNDFFEEGELDAMAEAEQFLKGEADESKN